MLSRSFVSSLTALPFEFGDAAVGTAVEVAEFLLGDGAAADDDADDADADDGVCWLLLFRAAALAASAGCCSLPADDDEESSVFSFLFLWAGCE